MDGNKYIITVGKEKIRLDKILALDPMRPGLTRTQLQRLITQEFVKIDSRTVIVPSTIVYAGQVIEIYEPAPKPALPQPQDLPLNIVYEDEDVIVLNKDPGMVVHPGAGHQEDTLVNALLAYCGQTLSGIGGVKRPGIVHRLDKGTSGLMVVAKHDQAHQQLALQFEDRTLSRVYQAVIWGSLKTSPQLIEASIGRHPIHRQKMAVTAKGKPAITQVFHKEALGPWASLVECHLKTGRTHQIRVHLTRIGHGLVGDPLYGQFPKNLPLLLKETLVTMGWNQERPALHAYRLTFQHPRTKEVLSFEASLPQDLKDLIQSFHFFCRQPS